MRSVSQENDLELSSPFKIINNFQNNIKVKTKFDNCMSVWMINSSLKTFVRTYSLIGALTSTLEPKLFNEDMHNHL